MCFSQISAINLLNKKKQTKKHWSTFEGPSQHSDFKQVQPNSHTIILLWLIWQVILRCRLSVLTGLCLYVMWFSRLELDFFSAPIGQTTTKYATCLGGSWLDVMALHQPTKPATDWIISFFYFNFALGKKKTCHAAWQIFLPACWIVMSSVLVACACAACACGVSFLLYPTPFLRRVLFASD